MRRLERSRNDRMLFGVCGGFGEYFGVNADVVRLVWIVLILMGGLGVLPYVAAILLLPEGEGGAPRAAGGAGRYFGFVLVGLGVAILLQFLDIRMSTFWMFRLVFPLLLLAGGALFIWPALLAKLGFSSGRPVRRSLSNRVLAGVAGGLADAISADPNLVRIGFVLAIVLTRGLGLLVYLALIPLWEEEGVAPTPPPPAPVSPPTPPPPATPPAPEASATPGAAESADTPPAPGTPPDQGNPQ